MVARDPGGIRVPGQVRVARGVAGAMCRDPRRPEVLTNEYAMNIETLYCFNYRSGGEKRYAKVM